jgi:membrane protein implicated in regulation of membrane protease activity
MNRILEIIMIVVLILLFVMLVAMPWPANAILGGIALLSFIVTFIHARQVKKKEQDIKQTNRTGT